MRLFKYRKKLANVLTIFLEARTTFEEPCIVVLHFLLSSSTIKIDQLLKNKLL